MALTKPIIGYEGIYTISTEGEVYNVLRNRFLKGWSTKQGYMRVKLSKAGSIPTDESKHRLVASHFIDNPENKPEVNHLDGNKSNNSISNLEWCTVQQNTRHAIDVTKTMICANWKGDKNPLVTLDYGLVYSIKFGVLSRLPIKTLASMFGLRQDTFRKILRNETWNHVIRLD